MEIISFINETDIICKILEHLGVCEEMTPVENIPPVSISEKNYEPNEDGWPQ
jgi:hypothetical protein